ncbi:MAG: DUF3710 domain-containing protein [Propionibacteriaceae bacterium]|nr:DUF3710 domain-containing protein [Propionibacteriaceae bacterium]
MFGRKRTSDRGEAADCGSDGPDENLAASIDLPAEVPPEDDTAAELVDQWEAFDQSADWRLDGPFDIDEVDLDDDPVKRLDLGALIITPEPSYKLRLMVDPKSKTINSVRVETPSQSAVQLTVLAAPADQSIIARLRQELVEAIPAAQPKLAKGPFGTEIRRLIPLDGPDGRKVALPACDWLIAGPKWVLSVQLLGAAALDTDGRGPAAELAEFVRNTIVRRGNIAHVPGNPLPLTPPSAGLGQTGEATGHR